MDLPWWLQKFMDAPWFEKLFWLFAAGVTAWIAVIWIKVLVEIIGFERSRRSTGPAKSGDIGGLSESASMDLMSFDSSSDSGSSAFSSDTGSDSGGGGSDFSGGGGDFGGGGSSGSW